MTAGFDCLDINECDGNHTCSDAGNCTNTVGGYNCTCNDGFYGDGEICIDADECAEVSDQPGEGKFPMNENSSYIFYLRNQANKIRFFRLFV